MNSFPPQWFTGFLSLIACTCIASADVRINEIMASNSKTVVPGAALGTFPDWVELYNKGNVAVDLSGWHLTDSASTPTKWTFPQGTSIAAGGYLIVICNNGDINDPGPLRAAFALSAGGEYLGLIRPEIDQTLTVVSEFSPGFPAATTDVSYGVASDGITISDLASPTPGAANSASALPPVAPITASTNRGFYTNPISVSLTTATSGAAIYYTIDSSIPLSSTGAPSPTAILYSGPISITKTTVIRSSATKSGSAPSIINTQSYIFPESVAKQTRPSNYPSDGKIGDYVVDQNVSMNETTGDNVRFQSGLREIPVVSVNLPMADMFGPEGVYILKQAQELEKEASAEYFKAAASGEGVNSESGFQINCGIRIQGGSSRGATKNSFSLRFRSSYGQGELVYPLFKNSPVNKFAGGLQLRAMYNNSWVHGSLEQRARATMITDQWMRDSHIAMGAVDAGRGHFVHLFINGLYWGVYNLHERPSDDHYASYNGQDLVEDDVVGYNPGGSDPHEVASYDILKNVVTSGTWNQISTALDIDSYIDFYLLQHFGRNEDLKSDGNWRAAGGGPSNSPWRLYLWDSERSLENRSMTGNLASGQDGPNFINRLCTFEEFRVRFADRAWKHFHHGGALTNEKNYARFLERVNELNNAIVGESARWGDQQSGGTGPFGDFTRTENWLPAIYGPLSVQPTSGVIGTNGWFSPTGTNRTEIFEAGWKTFNWPNLTISRIPPVNPPEFTVNGTLQHGGLIPNGGALRLTGGTGQLYVTTDGSDPRLTGGAVKPGLTPYIAGNTISLNTSSLVKARWLSGGRWSALNEAFFYKEAPAQAADLRISEIHYYPAAASALENLASAALATPKEFEPDDFQFLEIVNVSPYPVNLNGVTLSGGVTFTFGNQVLAAGSRTVVVEDATAFALRYGSTVTPAGAWSGALAHNGELIVLSDSQGNICSSVTYGKSAPWPTRPSSLGSSLEIIDTAVDPNLASNWRASVKYHGTPGIAGIASDGRIRVNEVLSNPASGGKDCIEIVNTTSSSMDLSGWYLSDGSSNLRKYRIPTGTTIPAGGYLVFDESQFNTESLVTITDYAWYSGQSGVTVTSPAHNLVTGDSITISGYGGTGAYNASFQVTVRTPDTFSIPVIFVDNAATKGSWTRGQTFGLSSSGEQVWITEGKAGGELVQFVDQIDFPATSKGQTVGRWPDSTGPIAMMSIPSFGATNVGPTGYLAWAAGYHLPINDSAADSDGDGIPDLGEYAMGLSPTQRNSNTLAKPSVVSGSFVLTYPIIAARSDVTTIVESSPDLMTPWTIVPHQVTGTANGIETRKVTVPIENHSKYFFRYRFTQ